MIKKCSNPEEIITENLLFRINVLLCCIQENYEKDLMSVNNVTLTWCLNTNN